MQLNPHRADKSLPKQPIMKNHPFLVHRMVQGNMEADPKAPCQPLHQAPMH
jgi:hypothetical protein